MTMISEDFLALANEVLSRAKATGPNPTSQRALEHILSELLSLRTSPPPSGEAGEPDGWQHRLFFDDTKAWSEWRDGKFNGLLANLFEERPLYALPTIKEPTDGK